MALARWATLGGITDDIIILYDTHANIIYICICFYCGGENGRQADDLTVNNIAEPGGKSSSLFHVVDFLCLETSFESHLKPSCSMYAKTIS